MRIMWMVAGLLVAAGASAQAPGWVPESNVEIVVGVAGGGNMDRTARALHQIIRDRNLLPVSSVVVNKPGGGQALGLAYVRQRQGDAHYLSINSEPLLTNRIAGRSPISHADFTPIAHLFDEYIAFAVRPDSPLRTGADLVAKLKADPGALRVGIGAARGNVNHIALALLAEDVNGDVKQVKIPVFNSMGETMTALLGGHIDLVVSTLAGAVGHYAGKCVRVLATTSPKRLTGPLADVPAWRELGHDVTTASFRVVLAPKGMSAGQVAYWESVMAKAVATEEWKASMERFYWIENFMNSAQTSAFLTRHDATLRKVYAEIGLSK